jgi:hypothetical protein
MRWRVLVLAALTASAGANSPEPSRQTIAAVANTCTAEGAFGHRFGEPITERGAGIAPFAIERPSQHGPDGDWVEITATASFAHAPMSQEDRVFLAKWVYEQLVARVAARKFPHRHNRSDGTSFIDPLFVLDLSRDETTVRLSCLKTSAHTP